LPVLDVLLAASSLRGSAAPASCQLPGALVLVPKPAHVVGLPNAIGNLADFPIEVVGGGLLFRGFLRGFLVGVAGVILGLLLTVTAKI
jgi:hypothetical protein